MLNNPLRKATRYLRERNWIRGQYSERYLGEPTGVCALGAIDLANREMTVSELSEVKSCLRDVLQEHGHPRSIPGWNDRHAKSVDEVIHMFKLAAERWDELHAKQPTP